MLKLKRESKDEKEEKEEEEEEEEEDPWWLINGTPAPLSFDSFSLFSRLFVFYLF